MITKIILGIIVLHLIAGFAYMVSKVSSKSDEGFIEYDPNQEDESIK